MDTLNYLLQGFAVAITPMNLMWCFIGCFFGTVIGILPVLGLMIVAVWLLGVGTLKDLALVQLVGMIVGAYSSIFFATPLLVTLKERWGPVAAHTKKVLARRAAAAKTAPAASGATAASAAVVSTTTSVTVDDKPARPAPATPRPGARPTGKRKKRR